MAEPLQIHASDSDGWGTSDEEEGVARRAASLREMEAWRDQLLRDLAANTDDTANSVPPPAPANQEEPIPASPEEPEEPEEELAAANPAVPIVIPLNPAPGPDRRTRRAVSNPQMIRLISGSMFNMIQGIMGPKRRRPRCSHCGANSLDWQSHSSHVHGHLCSWACVCEEELYNSHAALIRHRQENDCSGPAYLLSTDREPEFVRRRLEHLRRHEDNPRLAQVVPAPHRPDLPGPVADAIRELRTQLEDLIDAKLAGR